MELVSSVSFTEIMLVSTLSVMLGGFLTSFFKWAEHPLVQALVNTTSMALKATEGVWKPALVALQPLGPVAIAFGNAVFTALVAFGKVVTNAVQAAFTFGESLGLNMTQTGRALLYGAKDFASSLFTVTKAFAYLIANTLSGVSYVINSFEVVGVFARRLLFESHLVTWQDAMDIAVPFAVVGCLVSFVLWRAYSKFAAPVMTEEEVRFPRRSSRIARKRAMMLCYDVSGPSLARKKTSTRSSNL